MAGSNGETRNNVGFIGVGQITSHLVEGLHHTSNPYTIVLSPRNASTAERLEKRFKATVAGSNQEVADSCDLVVLATPPGDILDAAGGVTWRDGQVVVSVAAGVTLTELAKAVGPAVAVRAMPITAAMIGESSTVIHPDNAPAQALFSRFGLLHAVDDEKSFEAASVVATYYGWVYGIMDEMTRWIEAGGVPEWMASDLVAQTTRGAAGMVLAETATDAGGLMDALARPGSYTAHGLDVLREHGSFEAIKAASDAVLAKIRGD